MKVIEGHLQVDKSKKVAVISSRFNHFITDRLVEGAKDAYVRQHSSVRLQAANTTRYVVWARSFAVRRPILITFRPKRPKGLPT
jgi:hypothetical protein